MALRRRGPRHGHDLFPGFTDVYEIGVGSLAVVFRAREIGTNRQVALKLLNVRDASPRSIESFERESIALGALSSHPNIVTLYRNFRTPDGRPVLVLELCSGAVADRLRNGAGLPVTDVVSIGVKIAGALETAHRGGILHRDVKPQNILVTEFGEPALADFGVAMLQSSTQTTAGLFDFTTLHAAPELLEGTGTSAATDVYELASSLYQLIAGQSAFRAYDGESPASVILRILRDPVRPLLGTEVPMALSDLLIRAMSKEKDERPPTAAEFAAELADVEIAQRWNRTQFLIRDPGPLGTGVAPAITRMPDSVPRGLPSTLVSAGPGTQLTPVGPVGPPAHAVPAVPVPVPVPEPAQPAAHIAAQPAAPPAAQPAAALRQAPAPPPPGRVIDAADWSAPTIVTTGGWTPPPAPAAAPAAAPAIAHPPVEPSAPVKSAEPNAEPVLEPNAEPVVEPVVAPPAGADTWWSPPPTGSSTGSLRALAAEPAATSPAAVPVPVPEPEPEPAESSWAPIDRPADPGAGRPAAQLPPADWAEFAPPPMAPPVLPPPPLATEPRAEPTPHPDAPQADAPHPDAPDPAPPTPTSRPRSRDRVPVEIDEELPPAGFYTPRHVPADESSSRPAQPEPATTSGPGQHEAAPPAAQVDSAAEAAAVPVWAVRAPAVAGATGDEGPQFISDLSMDPMSLRPKTTIRAGASSVTVDEQQLRLRTWFKRSSIAWADIHGFEPQLDTDDGTPAVTGQLVALASGGPVELPGTRRPLAELRYLHALLDAYRLRARYVANR